MADRYWVGGNANWDGTVGTKWATTSNGTGGASVPTSADDVFFDVFSTGTCTIATGNTGAKSINCTGFTGTIAGTATISVAGSITLFVSQTYTHTGRVTITGTGTLTTAGKTFSPFTVDGSGITVTLGDALSIGQGDLIITQGTFTTSGSNYSITAGRLQSDNSNIRTITLNASTVTLSQGVTSPTLTFATSTNLTFNAGTSTINCNQPNTSFNGGSQTFYNVAIGDTQNNSHTMTGANTFNNLTINNRNANGTNRLSLAANITVNGTFTSNGTQTLPYRRCWIYSSVAGTNRTITAAAISIFGTDFRNITGAGAASWSDSSRTGYWGDTGGNSGITFATGRNAYWNLAGTQVWTATAWALTNNGAPADANYPLVQDTAIFTEAGAAGTVTLDIQNLMLPTVTMADGVSNRTSAMTLNFGTGDRDNFFGNITFFSNLTLSGGGARAIRLSGYGNTQSITTAGKTLVTNLEVNESFGNTVQLQDDLTLPTARTLTVTTGTFNANGYNVSTGTFNSSNSNTRTITMGNGLWTLSGTGTVWSTSTTTGLTFNKGTSNILLSDTSTSNRGFNGGALTYNKLTIGGTTGTSTTVFGSTNTVIGELASTKTVAHTMTFSGTHTITTWLVTGTAGNVVTVNSNTVGTARTVTITNKTINIDYLSVRDINNTNINPVTFYAGVNSTNNGNNTGVAFIARTAASPQNAHILTSGTTFTVPADWNSSNNNIYMIGAGGGGGTGAVSGNNRAAGGGGGGGAFTQLTNFTATPSGSVTYAIGTSAANTNGGNTTWDSGTYLANGGLRGDATTTPTSAGGAGGTAQTVSGIIAAAFAGGNGGAGAFGTVASTIYGSGGGGGAGGPNGVGGNGGTGFGSTTQANVAGGGGGGNGGGSNGGNAASATFGAGGNNFNGTGGATTVATNGTFGGGGSGGVNIIAGGSGGSGIDILNTLGGGGGRGGAAASSSGTNTGLYGGGGGGGGVTLAGSQAGGAGSQGVIFIVYTPSGAVINTSNFFFMMGM